MNLQATNSFLVGELWHEDLVTLPPNHVMGSASGRILLGGRMTSCLGYLRHAPDSHTNLEDSAAFMHAGIAWEHGQETGHALF